MKAVARWRYVGLTDCSINDEKKQVDLRLSRPLGLAFVPYRMQWDGGACRSCAAWLRGWVCSPCISVGSHCGKKDLALGYLGCFMRCMETIRIN